MPPRTQAPPANLVPGAGSTLRRAQRLQKLPPARRILGVDPGLHRTGYGMISMDDCGSTMDELNRPPAASRRSQHPLDRIINRQSSLINLVEGGVLRAKATDALCERLQTLHDALCQVLEEHRPDVMVIEELFSTYGHPRSALLMAHARGVLMLAAQQANVAVHSFLPNEVKQVVTGNGHAGKAQVQAAVQARLRLNVALEPPDVADALALALCFAARQQTSERLGS